MDHLRKIDPDTLQFISKWTRLHTYYTQVICNRLFTEGYSRITLPLVLDTCNQVLKEQEANFFQYRSLLTSNQWQLLRAIAKEDKVYQPNAKEFIARHNLGTPSHVKRSVEALMAKEMIYNEPDEKRNYYRVYDCFLSRWLERS